MSLVEFPYIRHKSYLMPIIPITILSTDEARRIGIDWHKGKLQMIVVGDGSFIPVYFHDLPVQINEWQISASVGFSERLGVGFNLLGRSGIFDQFQICFNDHTCKVTFQKL